MGDSGNVDGFSDGEYNFSMDDDDCPAGKYSRMDGAVMGDELGGENKERYARENHSEVTSHPSLVAP